jgi:N-acetylmuramoyl-L-alanine amidase
MSEVLHFANPASNVSATFLVGRDGRLGQFVSIHDHAFHAGIISSPTWPLIRPRPANPNEYTVGIEHEGTGRQEWTEKQWLTSAMLNWWLALRFGWPLLENSFPPHRTIRATKSCPGTSYAGTAEHLERIRAVQQSLGEDIRDLIVGIR